MSRFPGTLQAAEAMFSNIKCSRCHEGCEVLNNMGDACKHVFCWNCVRLLKELSPPQCPICVLPLDAKVKKNKLMANLYEYLSDLKTSIKEYSSQMDDNPQGVGAVAHTQALLNALDEGPRRTVDDFMTQRMYPEYSEPSIVKEEELGEDYCVTQPLPENLPRGVSVNSDQFSDEIDVGGDLKRERETPPLSKSLNQMGNIDFMDTEEIRTTRHSCPIPDNLDDIGGPLQSSTQQVPPLFQSQMVFTQALDNFPERTVPEFKLPQVTSHFKAQPRSTFATRQRSIPRQDSVEKEETTEKREIRESVEKEKSRNRVSREERGSTIFDDVPLPHNAVVMPRRTRSTMNKTSEEPPASPVLFASQQFTQAVPVEAPVKFEFNPSSGTSYFSKKPERGKTFSSRNKEDDPVWPPSREVPSSRVTRSSRSSSVSGRNTPRSRGGSEVKEEEAEMKEKEKENKYYEDTPKRPKQMESLKDREHKEKRGSGVLKPGEFNVINAVLKGDIRKLEFILKEGVDVNERDQDLCTPIFYAAERNRSDMCEILIQAGAIINAHCGRNCDTPLHAAVRGLKQKAVEYLLSKGANKLAKNILRETPMDLIKISTSPVKSVLHLHKPVPIQPVYPYHEWRVCIPLGVGLDQFRTAAHRLFQSVTDEIEDRTTHIVMGGVDKQRGVEYSKTIVEAMARGLFVVSSEWLAKSIQSSSMQEEREYEVDKIIRYGTTVPHSEGKCKESRRLRTMLKPPLFFGATFFMVNQSYKFFDKTWLKMIIQAAGGKVVHREPGRMPNMPAAFHDSNAKRSPYFVVYCPSNCDTQLGKYHSDPGWNMVSPSWVEESIMMCTVQSSTY